MQLPRHLAARCFLLGLLLAAGSFHPPRLAASDEFEAVGRLLIRHCLECHNARQASGGLVLESRQSLAKGGESGPVLKPGDAEAGNLLQRVLAGEMPPEIQGRSQRLPNAEIEALRTWIKAGADWPEHRRLDLYELSSERRGGRDHWSLQPVQRPAVPRLASRSQAANPIDAFLLAGLDSQQMRPAPPADRRTLIRRLYFDLIGLPPSEQEIEAFRNDPSPQAYERLVDRLLASPHFGERWGRYWLDLVRFAETCGYERDQVKPGVWKYRDWVIQAINDDKPYDRFVIEQLAGDELPERNEQSVIATGFLRLGSWNDEPNDPQEYKYERLEDMVHAASTALLAMTVKCARCHDHKFDAIPQVDYYRMASAFWAGYIEPGDRKLLGGPSASQLGYDVFGWTDRGRDPPPLHLLLKGDPKRPGPIVPFAHLTMFPELQLAAVAAPAESKSTQRRLQLANWIAQPDNPLTARVIVNRLWQHHFGLGLVRSPNNFGFKGERPTHPALLDWLAAELVSPSVGVAGAEQRETQRWRLKRLHKLMLLSRAYRQSSNHPQHQQYAQRDFANRWWWRAERRRLDAEAMRDAMLAVSGSIDLRLGGPSFRPTIQVEALEGLSRKAAAWTASPPSEQLRRSVYIFTQRSLLPPLMTTFDFADTTLPCGKREVTTVAPQALALLNNAFVHERSQALAKRIVDAAGRQPEQQVEAAWRFALARTPSAREKRLGLSHLQQQRAAFEQRAVHRDAATLEGELPLRGSLALHLRADRETQTDAQNRLSGWRDLSGRGHHASQNDAERRPQLVKPGGGRPPRIRFDGRRRFLSLAGQVLQSQEATIFAVVSDTGGGGHREIFSNWNGAANNSVSSLFLGLTGEAKVRFSDHFAAVGKPPEREQLFALTAIAGRRDTVLFQDSETLGRRGEHLPERNLQTAYVIGQQGNIEGEYWSGDIAELIVFNRELQMPEVQRVWRYLAERYELRLAAPGKSAELLALESLCHVLLNANEFHYVD